MTTTTAEALAPVDVFVAGRGNAFMIDIARTVAEAATELGHPSSVVSDRFPERNGSINLVVAPHEFFVLPPDGVDASDEAVQQAARCSIPVCTEQPGTPWFYMSLGFAQHSPLLVDINAAGTEALAELGYPVQRLRLGGTPSMDRGAATGVAVDRDIDVLFLGGLTDERAAALARLGPVLWNRRSDLRLFTFNRPVTGDEPGLVFGDDKFDLLRRSKVLVNVHRDSASDGYFEWARMIEAMANGCVVVTEPCRDHDPLVAGEHFVESSLDGLADTVSDLLADDDRRSHVATAAHRAVMVDGSLATQLDPVLRAAASALDTAAAVSPTPVPTGVPMQRTHAGPLLPEFRPHASVRGRLYRAIQAETEHRRQLGRLRCELRHGTPDHVDRIESDAWRGATPRISVVVTLYNYADVVADTIDSIWAAAGERRDIELIVVDDHSSDTSLDVVTSLLNERPELAWLVLSSAINRGLPASRNLAIDDARGEFVMIMDADNLVYPTCFDRLESALDNDATAAFAYATLEAFGDQPGLRSALGWYVPWLTDGNYIDAQSMIRRSAFQQHGGYRADDPMVFGWEDWELWLRLAAAGEHGVHVAEMLGRYRTQATSMISISNLVADEMRAHIRQLHPSLPWPD